MTSDEDLIARVRGDRVMGDYGPISDEELVRDLRAALLLCTRNLGRLGNGGERLPEDESVWRVPDEALNTLDTLARRLEELTAFTEKAAHVVDGQETESPSERTTK